MRSSFFGDVETYYIRLIAYRSDPSRNEDFSRNIETSRASIYHDAIRRISSSAVYYTLAWCDTIQCTYAYFFTSSAVSTRIIRIFLSSRLRIIDDSLMDETTRYSQFRSEDQSSKKFWIEFLLDVERYFFSILSRRRRITNFEEDEFWWRIYSNISQ